MAKSPTRNPYGNVTTGVYGNNADMYQQGRGSNGQFNNRKVQAGPVNRLTHYDSGEQRRIKTQSGRSVNSRTFNNLVDSAGMKSERRFNY